MSISPPPLKRRRLSTSSASSPKGLSNPIGVVPAPTVKISSTARLPSLRVFSWNINGISSFLPSTNQKILYYLVNPPKPGSNPTEISAGLPSLRQCLQRWQWPHIICLQEVKIARADLETQSRLRRLINKKLDDEPDDVAEDKSRLYTPHFSLPRDKYNATGFGGKVHGVCTLLRQDLQYVQVKEIDWDLEGRVLITELPASALVVINVYCVNGTDYSYRSPTTGLKDGNRHTHKRNFHSHLRDQVLAYETAGWEVLVIGDINVARKEIDSFPALRKSSVHVANRLDFEEKIIHKGDTQPGAGMVDVFRRLHGLEARKFTHRPTMKPWGEGGDRVDMALVTRGLVERVKEADILDTEEERGPSDHVPIFVEFGEKGEVGGKEEEEDGTATGAETPV